MAYLAPPKPALVTGLITVALITFKATAIISKSIPNSDHHFNFGIVMEKQTLETLPRFTPVEPPQINIPQYL